jgi:hypothetical protein
MMSGSSVADSVRLAFGAYLVGPQKPSEAIQSRLHTWNHMGLTAASATVKECESPESLFLSTGL